MMVTAPLARRQDAETTRSPLILDLNGDGVKTLNPTAGKHFDHAGDGFVEVWAPSPKPTAARKTPAGTP